MGPVKLHGDTIYNLIQILMVLEERKMREQSIDFVELKLATGMDVPDLLRSVSHAAKLRLLDIKHCNYYRNNGILNIKLADAEMTRNFLRDIYNYAVANDFGNSTDEIIEILKKLPLGKNTPLN